jgi:NAD+ synthase (glutamine-hydrolysing)
MDDRTNFHNLYSHDFARVAVAVPICKVAEPTFNAVETKKLILSAVNEGATLVAFPELGLTAYTCDDLFHQRALLDSVHAAMATILDCSKGLPILIVVGAPIRVDHRLFNCAVALCDGRILGVVPKTYLPNYGEFYEARQFNSADQALSTEVRILDQDVAFGSKLVFSAIDLPMFKVHVELCEDVWSPIPPSSFASLFGATILVNLSASNITVGKSAYRHQLVSQQSARCLAAYVYTSAGSGESTTDMAWDGQALIYENGELLAEAARFSSQSQVITADVDLERVSRERMRQTSFGQAVRIYANELREFRTIEFTLNVRKDQPLSLRRRIERFPYVPSILDQRNERCQEVYNIQVQALVQRLSASGIQKVVLGISGGLDSTHALLVCAKAMDQMGLPRANILGYTMPGYATSARTLHQARMLMAAVGCASKEIDIRPSCEQMFKDLEHPFSAGSRQYDITFENVQAGERTNHLFRLANFNNAIVVGTGDLSELALGWCTYGVGDHMSHYNVNASVPKTLIRHLVRWVAESQTLGDVGNEALHGVLETQISPELVPGIDGISPEQSSESTIGPYDLQDFNLYYTLRYGFAPSKIAFLAFSCWGDRDPDQTDSSGARQGYELKVLKDTLRIFLSRFFKNSQFKRTCVPNAPKVGNGGSLSPRGDWRAPSDSESEVWIADLDRVPDTLSS